MDGQEGGAGGILRMRSSSRHKLTQGPSYVYGMQKTGVGIEVYQIHCTFNGKPPL